MRAALFHGPERPLTIDEVPTPAPGPGEVLLRVAACGLCHSDLHYIAHGVATVKPPPLILGHEAAGTIAALGPGVTEWHLGDRVLLPPVLPCGRCRLCRTGRENICPHQRMVGNHIDGAFAEYVVAPAKDIVSVPAEIPLETGCVIADALSTPYHAVKNRAQVRPGDVVVVLGCGGIGINVVQVAAAAGATVIAVDINEGRLERARSFGAAETVNPTGREWVKEVRRSTDGGPDIVIEAIGNPQTIEAGYDLVRVGGRLCVIGYTNQPVRLNPAKLMYREVDVVGSLGCRPLDFPPLLDMVRRGRLQIEPLVTHRFPLEKIGEAVALLEAGAGLRSVIIP